MSYCSGKIRRNQSLSNPTREGKLPYSPLPPRRWFLTAFAALRSAAGQRLVLSPCAEAPPALESRQLVLALAPVNGALSPANLLSSISRAVLRARYEYPVSHRGRKQATSGLSGWLYPAWGSSLLGAGGEGPWAEQSQPTGSGSDGERRFIQTGQFLWPRSDEGSQGRQRQAERRKEGKHTQHAVAGYPVWVCANVYIRVMVCVPFLFLEHPSTVSL
ncbi:unnamed protein product [Tetraodon nigroviridis]|uniref:(spotted green pufferfish) hypothetical protein n=1 Tax=Tetraodon nigroviridis TaxID=99883 RepID=Q4SQY5_TETNG|nr:unnamed protein product [Tetraodon nigroviridis]